MITVDAAILFGFPGFLRLPQLAMLTMIFQLKGDVAGLKGEIAEIKRG